MEEPLRLSPLAWIDGEWTTAPPATARSTTELQLITWNTWFGGHMFEERTAALLAELERRSPHLIALQEVSAAWRATSIELLGTQPIDVDETFISDHFGLAVSLQATASR